MALNFRSSPLRLGLFFERKLSQMHTRPHLPPRKGMTLGPPGNVRLILFKLSGHLYPWRILKHKRQRELRPSALFYKWRDEKYFTVKVEWLDLTQWVSEPDQKSVAWYFQFTRYCYTNTLLNLGLYFNKRLHAHYFKRQTGLLVM